MKPQSKNSYGRDKVPAMLAVDTSDLPRKTDNFVPLNIAKYPHLRTNPDKTFSAVPVSPHNYEKDYYK